MSKPIKRQEGGGSLFAVCIIHKESERWSAEAVREDLLELFEDLPTIVLGDKAHSLIECFGEGGALIIDTRDAFWAKARLRRSVQGWLRSGDIELSLTQKLLQGIKDHEKNIGLRS